MENTPLFGDTPLGRQVSKQIALYCKNKDSFVGIFGVMKAHWLGLKLFSSLSYSSGQEGFGKFLSRLNIIEYLSSRPDLIVAVVIGLLCIIFSAVYIFCSSRKVIKKNRINNSSIYNVSFPVKKIKLRQAAWLIGLFVLVGLGLLVFSCFIIYITVEILKTKSPFMCDQFMTLKGYFDGVENIRAPPGIITEWKGAIPQLHITQTIQSMIQLNDNNRTRLEEDTTKLFYGKEGPLETLKATEINLRQKYQRLLVLYKLLTNIQYPIASSDILDTDHPELPLTFSIDKNPVKFFVGGTFEFVMKMVIEKLHETQTILETTFNEIKKTTLENGSSLILKGLETTQATYTMVSDINHVFNFIGVTLLKLKTLIILLLNLTIAFAFIISIFSIALLLSSITLYKLAKNRQIIKSIDKVRIVSPPKLLKGTYISYYLGLFLSSFIFFFSCIMLVVSSMGSDTCHVISKQLLEQGNWTQLPPQLIHSLSNTTNIPRTLDICLKNSGSGDIVGESGIKILSTKLENYISEIQQNVLSILNKNMDTYENTLGSNVIYNMTHQMINTLYTNGASTVYANYGMPIPLNEIKQYNYCIAYPFDHDFMSLCLTPGLEDLLSAPNLLLIIAQNSICLSDVVVPFTTAQNCLKYLNNFIYNAYRQGHFKYTAICPEYLYNDNICQGILTTEQRQNIFKLKADFTMEDTFTFKSVNNNIFKENDIVNLLLKQSFKEKQQNTTTAFTIIKSYYFMDAFMKIPITNEFINKKLLTVFSTTKPEIAQAILKASQENLKCVETDTCTNQDYYKQIRRLGSGITNTMLNEINKSNLATANFVDTGILKTTQYQIDLAHQAINNTNCKYINSVLKNVILYDACHSLLPSIGLLGIALLFTSIFMFIYLGIYSSLLKFVKYSYHEDFVTNDVEY